MSATGGGRGLVHPAAELDRRFYAFTLDRLLAWTLYAVAVFVAWTLFLDDGSTAVGIALVAGVVVVVSLAMAAAVGLTGSTPGKALVGLRVVDEESGGPVGLGRGLLRTAVLGVAALPTAGFGVATLAWTAVMDRDHQRRGWHDHLARSVVVDVRPAPEEQAAEPERPRQIVNLTAMRLVPASPTPPRQVPARVRRSRWAAGPTSDLTAPATPASALDAPVAPAAPPSAPAEPVPAASAPQARPAQPDPAPADDQPVWGAGDHLPEAAAAVIDQAPLQPVAETDPDALVDPLVDPLGAPARGGSRRADAGDALSDPPSTAAGAGARHAARPAASGAPSPPAAPVPPRAAPARWSVVFDTGEAFVVDGFTLVGRNPEPRTGEPVKRKVALRSSDMSLSKTHAQFQVVPDGALVVMDRGSTNGSLLVRGGVTKELGPGRPATLRDGDVVRFGDREMRVTREA